MNKKYLTLLASVVIMLCIGGVYAWSIFVPPLKTSYGLTTTQTQAVFGFTIAFFTIAMIIAGKIEKKFGAKITAFIGMILFVAGYLSASISKGNFIIILIGVGILSGTGIGFGYLAALVSPVKWFPHKKGLITGLAVAGFGGGAILLSNMVDFLLNKNMDVLDIFRLIGIFYSILILLSIFLLSAPPTEDKSEMSHHRVANLIKDRVFWGVFFAMFAGTFAGLMVIGNLKPIGLSNRIDGNIATLGISLLSLGNMVGRVLWGYISDRIGGKTTIILAMLFLSIFTLALLTIVQNGYIFLFIAFAIGIGFGANFVLFAREVSQIYGVNNLGLVYPYVFLSYGLAGLLGPTIGGRLFDVTQSYTLSIIVSAGICAIGLIANVILTRRKNNSV